MKITKKQIEEWVADGIIASDYQIRVDSDGDRYIAEEYFIIPIVGWCNDGTCDYEARLYLDAM